MLSVGVSLHIYRNASCHPTGYYIILRRWSYTELKRNWCMDTLTRNMPSKKQYNLVPNDEYDTRIPMHPEEAFEHGITFHAKVRRLFFYFLFGILITRCRILILHSKITEIRPDRFSTCCIYQLFNYNKNCV